jgi:hypothetical protein
MLIPERLHLCANRVRNFAADIRVDLIEDEKRNRSCAASADLSRASGAKFRRWKQSRATALAVRQDSARKQFNRIEAIRVRFLNRA